MKRKNKVVDSELNIVFKGGKMFTYKRVLKYTPNWEKGTLTVVTKTFEGEFVKTLHFSKIKSITEKLTRKIMIHE